MAVVHTEEVERRSRSRCDEQGHARRKTSHRAPPTSVLQTRPALSMLRLTVRPLCTLRAAAAAAATSTIAAQTGWAPLAGAAYSSLATLWRPSLSVASLARSRPAAVSASRSFASGAGDDDGDRDDFEPGPVMVGGLPTGDPAGEREKPAVGANLGRASKADRAALKAKQKRASKAVAEEAKHARAKQEKERTKQMRAAAQRSLADALNVDDAVPDSTGAEAEARQQARELGIEAAKDELGLDPSTLDASKPVSRTAAEALAKAAASVVIKGKPGGKDDTPLNRAMAAAAALTAGGKKASPAALAAAAAEVNRLKALQALESKIVRLNEKITAPQIILLGSDGKKLPGVFTRSEALAKGKAAGLDLLQISPPHLKDQPAVVKMLDYNRHVSDQSRREADARRAQKLTVLKESKTIQLKSKIAAGDLKVKIASMAKFLRANHPVKIIYISKNPDPLIFFPLLQSCVEALVLEGSLSDEKDLSPEKHWVHLQPLSEKKRQALYPKLTEEQRTRFGVSIDAQGRWSEKGRGGEEKEDDPGAADAAEDAEDAQESDAAAATPASAASSAPKPATASASASASAAATPKPAAAAASRAATDADEEQDEDDDEDEDEEDDDEDEDDEPRQKPKGGKGAQKKQQVSGGKKAQQKTSYVVATPLFSQTALRAKLAQQQQQGGKSK